MPARTYSTDVYLSCPCAECEGRKVRITLRSSGSLSRLRAAAGGSHPADSAGPRWAVSTGVGRWRSMTFRWSRRAGEPGASDPGCVVRRRTAQRPWLTYPRHPAVGLASEPS
jgi:hypothetical protein